MKRFRGLAITSLVLALAAWFLYSQTRPALMQKKGKQEEQTTLVKPKDILVKEFLRDLNKDIEPGSILMPGGEYDENEEDPDLPPGMAGLIDKEAYLRLRGDYIDLRRGRPFDEADEIRSEALRTMADQEKIEKRKSVDGLSAFDAVN